MAALPQLATNTPVEIPSDLVDNLYTQATESVYIGAGRGSALYIYETLLTQHDRFAMSPVMINTELVGLTFITRPRLNLTTTSLRMDPTMAMLATEDPENLMFSIRCYLDTVFADRPDIALIAQNCPFFNDTSAFNIPLSNLLLGISGWPDFSLETETTRGGYFSEDMTLVRGSDWGRRTYDLSLTFRDIQGGYLMAMIYYWLRAMGLLLNGTMIAYPEDRRRNRLNYTCSIYRFVLSADMSKVVKWAKATGCYPVSIPMGDVFNYGPGENFIHTSQQFTVPFKANHISYMDPRTLAQFNTLVRRYAGSNVASNGNRVLAPITAASNFCGLPYVDLTNGNNTMMYLAEPEELIDPTVNAMRQIQESINSYIASKTTSSSLASSSVASTVSI